MPETTDTEFAITFDELNFGLDLEASLHNLGERTACVEIRYFITAVLIQRDTGGNLADVLNRISAVMRSRASTEREIRVLAAEMDYSAKVLIFLPFIVAGILMIVNPSYLTVLFEHELGTIIIGVQLLLIAVGYAIIKHMINFKV
jgi:tight adherence protein B